MYLSRIVLATARLPPSKLIEMMERGEYAMHQWLWELFPGVDRRNFLYRREELQGGFCFYLLSVAAPVQQHAFFEIATRPFSPALEEGTRLRFSLRANPVVCKNGKRHDVLMDVKHALRQSATEHQQCWEHQQHAALDWLHRQGERTGFRLEQATVDAYRQQQMSRVRSRDTIQFSSVDFGGTLVVTRPGDFQAQLEQGFGKARAFGCGLMLIKPGDDT